MCRIMTRHHISQAYEHCQGHAPRIYCHWLFQTMDQCPGNEAWNCLLGSTCCWGQIGPIWICLPTPALALSMPSVAAFIQNESSGIKTNSTDQGPWRAGPLPADPPIGSLGFPMPSFILLWNQLCSFPRFSTIPLAPTPLLCLQQHTYHFHLVRHPIPHPFPCQSVIHSAPWSTLQLRRLCPSSCILQHNQA